MSRVNLSMKHWCILISQLVVYLQLQRSPISLCLHCLTGFWLCQIKLTNLSFKSTQLWCQVIPISLNTLENCRRCSTALWLSTQSTFHFTNAKMSTVRFVSSMNRPKTLELSVSSVMKATLLMTINSVKSFLLRSSKYFKNSIQR